jgi:hypothetical protein
LESARYYFVTLSPALVFPFSFLLVTARAITISVKVVFVVRANLNRAAKV